MRRFLALIWLLCAGLALPGWTQPAWAQTTVTLSGRVTDASTGQPLPFANVYLNNTTRGTTTDEQGRYSLANVPMGSVEVVASFVGYEPQRVPLRSETAGPRQLQFVLKPLPAQELAGVTVTAKRDKVWERQFRRFSKELLGNSPFTDQCRFLNGEVVEFTEKNSRLRARASRPLEMENRALGYKLIYELTHFDANRDVAYYGGNTRFTEMPAPNARTAERWRQNRQRAYEGSTRHLLASMLAGTAEAEGFLVYAVNPRKPLVDHTPLLTLEVGRHLLPLRADTLFKPAKLPFERWLIVPEITLDVFYTKVRAYNSLYRDAPYAYSRLTLPSRKMGVTTTGAVVVPNGYLTAGYLAADRLSRLLPDDWLPNGQVAVENAPPGQQTSPILATDRRVDSLKARWAARNVTPAPTVFLQPDKPLYATGDSLWLSAFVLDAPSQRLQPGPDALHAELWSPAGKRIQHHWLNIDNGRGAGQMALPDTLPTGTYRLRAFTEADRQNGRAAFERSVIVLDNQRPAMNSPSRSGGIAAGPTSAPDIQFLPEGSQYVVGLPARLGIKALGPDGHGLVVQGRIVDGRNREIATFQTNALGMGSVAVTPAEGEPFRAEGRTATGATFGVTLPRPLVSGLTLAAETDSANVAVTVRGSGVWASQPVYLALQARHRLLPPVKVQLRDGKAEVDLPLDQLPAGLAQLTLFDAGGRPRAERLLFVAPRTAPLTATFTTDKKRYVSERRDTLALTVNVTDAGATTYALSVADAQQVPADTAAADLRAHLLLTGELSGLIENPGYYVANNRPETRRALDDLLLTQGWRRLSWQASPDYPAAADTLGGIALSGQVLTDKGEGVPNAEIVLLASGAKTPISRSLAADAQGRFFVGGLYFDDTITLTNQLRDYKFKPLANAQLWLDAPGAWLAPPAPTAPSRVLGIARLRTWLDQTRQRQEADPARYRLTGVRQLSEVTIRSKKYPPDNRPESVRSRSLHDSVDDTILFDEKAPQFANLYQLLAGRAAGVNVVPRADSTYQEYYQVSVRGGGISFGNAARKVQNPLFIVNGFQVIDNDGRALMSFNPSEIERIEILKNPATTGIYGVQGGNGVIAFYTKGPQQGRGAAVRQLIVNGLTAAREFYIPKYVSAPENGRPPVDRRDVLFWQPMGQTDATGQATVRFPLTDVVRDLRVTVQGLTADGRPVSTSAVLNVR